MPSTPDTNRRGSAMFCNRQRLARTLKQDLPLQYEKPQDLSIFGDDVAFQDPVTTLRGKLPYRGMLCELRTHLLEVLFLFFVPHIAT